MPKEKKSHAELMQELAEVRSRLAARDRECRELQQLDRQYSRLSDMGGRRNRLFDAMMEGFGLAEIILDEAGLPYDFRLLEINEATGRLINIAPDKLGGITVRQLFPVVDTSWIELLGKVVLTREPAQFEKYSPALHKWLAVYAFSPEPNLLAFLFLDTTERKQAEEHLKHSRVLLAEAERLSHTGAWEWDLAADRWAFSDEWLKIHGCSKRTLETDELMEIAHPKDRGAIAEALQNVRNGIAPYDIEHRIVRRDNGNVRFVGSYGKFVRDASGKVVRVYGFARDITEQKRSEMDKERQNKLMMGINRIFGAVMTSAVDEEFGNICLAVAEEVTESGISFLGEIGPDGLLHDIAISNPFWEACPLYDRESPKIPKTFHIRGIYAGIITDGIIILSNDPSSHPQSIGVPPGHPPLTCFLGAPLKQEDRTIGMIAVGNREGGYGPDDRRTMEVLAQVISEALARRRTEEALRQSEIRYRSLFMHSPDAIFISRNDRVTLVNDACLNLFGALKAEKLLGKASFDLFHADYHPAIREHLKRMQDSSEALSLPEGKIIRLDGFSVEVEVIAAHFPFNGSSAIHIILRDITARRRAARDLEHSNKELEQFAYAASHDLQEPLRSIVSFLQLLQHHYKDRIDEKGRQYIERAVAAGNRMQTLIRDLLSLSHVTTGDCRFEPTDLNRLVETVLDNLESTLRLNNADVVHTDLPSLSVDGSQIRSLFQNLIANGIKYNKDPSPRVAISCRRYDNGYEFLVKDNGIGIEPRFHEHIFMVFQRLHAAGEYEGTGLGLALCRKIVERHGGTIWVESNPGEGSTFHFTLPKSR